MYVRLAVVLTTLDGLTIEKPYMIKLLDTEESYHETILFLEPLLSEDFQQLIREAYASFDYVSRLRAASQIMQAIAWLHDRGTMHRDIKPANMGLKTRSPVHAILFDLGCATNELPSDDHNVGTIIYLAPEILSLKNGSSTTPYGLAADVWASGLSVVQLLYRTFESFVVRTSNPDEYRVNIGPARGMIQTAQYGVRSVLERMIEESPIDRV